MLFFTKKIVRRLTVILAAGIALAKFNAAVTMFLSLVVSLLAYAIPFGIWYAVGLVGLLFAHEFGHVVAARTVGIRATWPIFIPFLGAVVRLRRAPVNAKMAANIAIGGPAMGTMSALLCIVCYLWTDSMLLLVLAYTACVFNLFNLIPCDPLDGSVIGESISAHLWIIGSAIIGCVFFYTYNILILLIFICSLHRLWGGRNDQNTSYYQLSVRQRIKVLCWYLGLVIVLSGATVYIADLLE